MDETDLLSGNAKSVRYYPNFLHDSAIFVVPTFLIKNLSTALVTLAQCTTELPNDAECDTSGAK